jgi:membrane-bound lytic murein transglycosylase D
MTFADPLELVPLRWYTVKKGETLLGLARKLGVTRADLADANYLSIRARLQPGQQLIVPKAPPLDGEPGEAAARTASAGSGTPTPAVTSHLVRRGDTLYSIARRYDTTVAAVQRWNRLRGTAIRIGQRLVIQNDTASATN